jgi:ABC-type sugar transport system substrate-binding protein
MKRVLVLAFLASGLTLAACGGKPTPTSDGTPGAGLRREGSGPEPGGEYPRPAKPSRSYRLGVVVPHLSNPHFVGQAYGYIDEAEALGAKVTVLEAGGYQYLDKQISQVEDLVASRVDAIILVAINGPGTVGAVERAVAAGIPVINCNVMTDSPNVVARIRSDDELIGRMQADAMGRALNGKGNVVMLRGAPGTSWAELRGNAFKTAMAERYAGVKILGEQYSQSTPADGLRLMEDFLQTYPDIAGVYNGSDSTAIGAAQAILASGKKGTVVTATDFQADTETFMREGLITATVLQQTVVIGRWGVRAAINHLERREVPAALSTPLLVATKDSLDSIDMRGVRAPEGWKPPSR